MTAEWIPRGNGFVEADVTRCTESVWRKRPRGWGVAISICEHVVIAKVIRNDFTDRED